MPLTIADLMEKMPGALIPEKAAGVDAVVHFKFTGAEAWRMECRDQGRQSASLPAAFPTPSPR